MNADSVARPLDVTIRAADSADAASAVEVIGASIAKLCADDHDGDPETLRLWLEGKTERDFARWLDDPEVSLVVAERQSEPLGVGSLHSSGQIRLLYVRPEAQGRGVGRLLLAELERRARSLDLDELSLDSSAGARAFYQRHGYHPAGPPTCGFGISRCHPFTKHLQ